MTYISRQIESTAYTVSRSRKYVLYKETEFAYKLIKRNYLWKWQLYRGDSKYPSISIMAAEEAIELNKEAAINFAEGLDTNPERKLWEWRRIGNEEYHRTKRMLVEELRREDSLDNKQEILLKIITYNGLELYKKL